MAPTMRLRLCVGLAIRKCDSAMEVSNLTQICVYPNWLWPMGLGRGQQEGALCRDLIRVSPSSHVINIPPEEVSELLSKALELAGKYGDREPVEDEAQ